MVFNPNGFTARVAKSGEELKIVLTLDLQMNQQQQNHTYEQRRDQAIANGQMEFELAGEDFLQEMQQIEQAEQAAASKDAFAEYEWMMNPEEFDESALKDIRKQVSADDLDDMFYWDVDQGCEGQAGGKNNSSPRRNNNNDGHWNNNNQRNNNNSWGSNQQNNNSWNNNWSNNNRGSQGGRGDQPGNHHSHNPLQQQSRNNYSNNPLSQAAGTQRNHHQQQRTNNYNNQHHHQQQQNQYQQQKQQQSSGGGGGYTFNPLARNTGRHTQSQYNYSKPNPPPQQPQQQPQDPIAQLTNNMNNVDLRRFHYNPEATSFVPSWLKK